MIKALLGPIKSGKTTDLCLLAKGYSEQGKKVLFISMDENVSSIKNRLSKIDNKVKINVISSYLIDMPLSNFFRDKQPYIDFERIDIIFIDQLDLTVEQNINISYKDQLDMIKDELEIISNEHKVDIIYSEQYSKKELTVPAPISEIDKKREELIEITVPISDFDYSFISEDDMNKIFLSINLDDISIKNDEDYNKYSKICDKLNEIIDDDYEHEYNPLLERVYYSLSDYKMNNKE